MMAMLVSQLKKHKDSEKSDEEKLMLETYGEKIDFSDKETILPLVSYVRNL